MMMKVCPSKKSKEGSAEVVSYVNLNWLLHAKSIHTSFKEPTFVVVYDLN